MTKKYLLITLIIISGTLNASRSKELVSMKAEKKLELEPFSAKLEQIMHIDDIVKKIIAYQHIVKILPQSYPRKQVQDLIGAIAKLSYSVYANPDRSLHAHFEKLIQIAWKNDRIRKLDDEKQLAFLYNKPPTLKKFAYNVDPQEALITEGKMYEMLEKQDEAFNEKLAKIDAVKKELNLIKKEYEKRLKIVEDTSKKVASLSEDFGSVKKEFLKVKNENVRLQVSLVRESNEKLKETAEKKYLRKQLNLALENISGQEEQESIDLEVPAKDRFEKEMQATLHILKKYTRT